MKKPKMEEVNGQVKGETNVDVQVKVFKLFSNYFTKLEKLKNSYLTLFLIIFFSEGGRIGRKP